MEYVKRSAVAKIKCLFLGLSGKKNKIKIIKKKCLLFVVNQVNVDRLTATHTPVVGTRTVDIDGRVDV